CSVLREQVLPSLLVRQFAFLHFDEGQARGLLLQGLEESSIPDEPGARTLLAGTDRYRPASAAAPTLPYSWVRLSVPLRVHQALVGVWFFGRRDPDDTYGPADIAVIQALADETAIALSNVVQAQRLRELSQANVTRNEDERRMLAVQLHDSILNQMAAVTMKMDGPSLTPAIQSTLEELSNRVRAIVSDLRPPMLAYGLKAALEELAETLSERSDHPVGLSLMPAGGDIRYPANVELHAFRIVQESCENAVRHSRADNISISGRLEPDRIELLMEDDGAGFTVPPAAALETLVAQKHFGLAGLLERANLIGAEVDIRSTPGMGTRILIRWSSTGAPARPPVGEQ
ncbi:MAG TPA: ATP-binding protein, partial [Anaerolineales bacterium]